MKHLKLILALLFLLCLAPMPYGFYSLVRFVAMIAFAIYAYIYHEKKNNKLAVAFLSLAILFQPLCVDLNMVDMLVTRNMAQHFSTML